MFRTAHATEPKLASSDRTSEVAAGVVGRRLTARGVRKYPSRLNFYAAPPMLEVTIDQFESWAIDRLRVLAEVESSQARNRSFAETRDAVMQLAKKYLPLNSASSSSADLDGERMKDHVSHFVLRLAFCRTDDLRKRFVKAETMLFRFRFDSDDASDRNKFLETLKLDQTLITHEEKMRNRDALLATNPFLAKTFDKEGFFKVHWTRVLDLVEKRRVFVKAGMAWVPVRDQSSLVVSEFAARLGKELELTSRALPRLDEDDRILPLLSHMSMGFIAGVSRETSVNAIEGLDGGQLTAGMVDTVIKQHAPPCMRNLHDMLQGNGHLRYNAREQYSLFLKDVGLPLEEAMLFWRRSFRQCTDDKFNKEYKYNLRWGYGLEGRKVNAPARNCSQIIKDQPGPQDQHGCPFRHFSVQNLSSMLITKYGLDFGEQAEILQAVKGGHYHVGCTRLFEMTHKKDGVRKGDGLGDGESVGHPNRYVERSFNLSRNDAPPSSTRVHFKTELKRRSRDEDMKMPDAPIAKQASSRPDVGKKAEPLDDEEVFMLMEEAARADESAAAEAEDEVARTVGA